MKKYFLFLILTTATHSLSAQVNTFIRELSPISSQYGLSYVGGVAYPNGNFLAAMEIHYNTLLVMLNASGDTIWTKEIDSIPISNINYIGNIAATFDGGCILLNGDYSGGGGIVILTKIDSTGNESWAKKYLFTGLDADTLSRVVQTKDSGYAFMAQVTNQFYNTGSTLVKVNGSGDTLWTHRYLFQDTEIHDFAEASDGGFYLIGIGFLGRTDPLGSIRWTKGYSLPSFSVLNFARVADVRNDTILVHEGYYWNAYNHLIELSDTGAVISAVRIDSPYKPARAKIISQGRILLTPMDNRGISLLDSQMNLEWSKSFNPPAWNGMSNYAAQAISRGDSSFWVFGNYSNGITGGSYFISTDSLGYSSCYANVDSFICTPISINVSQGLTIAEDPVPFQVSPKIHSYSAGLNITELCNVGLMSKVDDSFFSLSPNPATNLLTITTNHFPINAIDIFDLLRQKVLAANPTSNIQHPISIDVSKLPAGIYFVQLKGKDFMETKKLIVAR